MLVEDCHSMRGNGNFLKVVRKIYENVPATFTCSKSLRKIKLRKSMELLFNNYSQFVSYKKTLYIRITCFQIFGVEKNCRRICRRTFLSNEPFYIVNKRDVSSARALEDREGRGAISPRGIRSTPRSRFHVRSIRPCNRARIVFFDALVTGDYFSPCATNERERKIEFVKPQQYGLFSLLLLVTRATTKEISDVGPSTCYRVTWIINEGMNILEATASTQDPV